MKPAQQLTLDSAAFVRNRPALAAVDEPAVIESATGEFIVGEFFAGIGLARLGLESAGAKFKVAWANDLDSDKQGMYEGNFNDERSHYHLEDIRTVAEDIVRAKVPTDLSLAWASFPCTDLSLAGGRQGLAGRHSSTFWDFALVLERLGARRPPVVAIENVNGFATSHSGNDIKAAVARLNDLGYSVDVLTLDARRWVPQSRPRLFLVAVFERYLEDVKLDERTGTQLRPVWLDRVLNDPDLITHRTLLNEDDPDVLPPLGSTGWTKVVSELERKIREKKLPEPKKKIDWWDEARTKRFTDELSEFQKSRIAALEAGEARNQPVYRTAYRRTRDHKPAWEIRADDVAGCLRTARGGSSKQAVVEIKSGEPLRVRWMTGREYAALMGAPEYVLPDNPNRAIMGFGDAVCVDAVRWLAANYLAPLLDRTLAAAQQSF
ncbi:DNA cytosine methyltransferase [Nocardia tengchongensis]|uniref:DNA cytosine methyltransferase n=1 Tax=Nocardia tengchongensis TaxID=2055889 RepID=UPI00368DED83